MGKEEERGHERLLEGVLHEGERERGKVKGDTFTAEVKLFRALFSVGLSYVMTF